MNHNTFPRPLCDFSSNLRLPSWLLRPSIDKWLPRISADTGQYHI